MNDGTDYGHVICVAEPRESKEWRRASDPRARRGRNDARPTVIKALAMAGALALAAFAVVTTVVAASILHRRRRRLRADYLRRLCRADGGDRRSELPKLLTLLRSPAPTY